MTLALDANAAISILRGADAQVRTRFRLALDAEPVWIGSVVVHELVVGALKSRRPVHHLEQVDRLVERLQCAEFTAEDAMASARVRADLEGAGRAIGSLDMLIAGQALARGWTLVTADLTRMLRVDGLTVVDWTRSDQPFDRNELLSRAMRQLGPAELARRMRQETKETK